MKKALHILALTSLVASASGCGPAESTPEESGILDEYVNDNSVVETPVTEQATLTGTSGPKTTPDQSPVIESAPIESSSKYTDGTYSASGKYQSPAGSDTLQVSITVKNDVVTAVNITPASANEVSLQIQGMFADGIGALVVGKSLDEIGGYSAVNGASLTPKGFDAALSQIRQLAQ